jgi:outer membrane protein assembly factor BamB
MTSRSFVLVSAWLCTIGVSNLVRADDWPGWRGPLGNGISLESSAPLSWSPTKNIAWKCPIPGVGLSSPIVVNDHVFVTTGKISDGSRHILCLDRNTGNVRWDVIAFRGPPGEMHRFNTTASSTPVSDGEQVFAVFNDDTGLHVFALDMEGQVLWSRQVGTFHSSHGFAASPILHADGVIVNGQQDGEAFVVKLDRRTGEEKWRYHPDVNIRSFSTPVLTVHEGIEQLILSGSFRTVGIDPNNGQPLWRVEGPSQKFVSTPSVGLGMVFSFGGSPEKKALAVRLGGQGDVSATHVAWRLERAMPYVPTPLLLGDNLHIVNDQGVYLCLDARTGRTLHMSRRFGPTYSSPISVAGRVYLFEDSGMCTVIGDGTEFNELSRNALGEPVQTTPAISNGQLFVRGQFHLYCIGPYSD